jgi:hypothetical protein
MRMRNKGETETYFLDSALFLGGFISGTLELYAMVGSLRFMRVTLGTIIRGLQHSVL